MNPKGILIAFFILIGNALQAQIKLMSPEELFAETYAVIVGVSNYPKSPLNYTDDDAFKFYSHLRSIAASGRIVPNKNITLLLDNKATKQNILAALESVVKRAKATDRIIFYINNPLTVEIHVSLDYLALTRFLSKLSPEMKDIFSTRFHPRLHILTLLCVLEWRLGKN